MHCVVTNTVITVSNLSFKYKSVAAKILFSHRKHNNYAAKNYRDIMTITVSSLATKLYAMHLKAYKRTKILFLIPFLYRLRKYLLSFSAESFVFQFAIQKCKD
jgi:hypothetical protein